MKTPSHDLFELIKALTKSEKTYFKKHITTIDKKQLYLQLFNCIDKQKIYDEAATIKQLKYQQNSNAFAVLKNYLYNEITTALTQYHQQHNKEESSILHIQQLHILAEKGLFSQYEKLWKKTYSDAVNKELFELQFMLRTHIHHLKLNFSIKTNHEELQKIIVDDEKFNRDYEELQKIKNLFLSILLYNKQSQIRILKEEIYQLEQIQKNELLQLLEANATFHYSYYFNFAHGLIYYLTHEFDKAFLYLDKIRIAILNNQSLAIANPYLNNQFITVFYLVSFVCKEFNSFFDYINHPFQAKLNTPQHKALIFAYKANSYLRYYISNGQYDKAQLHLQKIEKEIDSYIAEIPIEIKQLLLGSMGISHFIFDNYNESYYRIKACLATIPENPRQDIQRYIYPFCILIAFEMKNIKLLIYECDNAYQFFKRKKMSSKFEIIFIAFFKKWSKMNYSRKEQKEKFSELRAALEHIKRDPILAQVFRYFNFYGWIHSKELGISYREYVQNRNKPA
jgi:hypothetical protein